MRVCKALTGRLSQRCPSLHTALRDIAGHYPLQQVLNGQLQLDVEKQEYLVSSYSILHTVGLLTTAANMDTATIANTLSSIIVTRSLAHTTAPEEYAVLQEGMLLVLRCGWSVQDVLSLLKVWS